ncbi:hypothetical protein BO83DRAFT_412346 [Aspergillus eucalypticola CBS 122712]|uniref:Uncharacterized protein n=1 Tax=Aspergillus eucalypticola (strain CBS 122712 / IBT 29274) TaxID=1448314 RepID=A0A317UN01_ASPEC|nr:uncharacterized protein BO83DRAFT_412346 [Aspergillus eucalypticola CBS 122712]PWY62865.1 hypothetical protein BO83DRAFT_412346 [Aspergillus eucalypticola CBS 122712]
MQEDEEEQQQQQQHKQADELIEADAGIAGEEEARRNATPIILTGGKGKSCWRTGAGLERPVDSIPLSIHASPDGPVRASKPTHGSDRDAIPTGDTRTLLDPWMMD